MRNRPVRMARWSARHPWSAIVGWFVFVVLCLGAGMATGSNAATAEDFRVGEAGHAESMAAEGGLQRRPTEHVLIRARSGGPDTGSAAAAARELTDRMAALPEVAEVAAPVRSRDGHALRVTVVLKGAELEGRKNVVPLLAQTAKVAADHPDLVVEETGSPAISKGVNDQRADDLALSERLTLPVTLVILLIVFGSVVMAGVPLLLALSSIAASLGLAMLASHVLPDPGVGTPSTGRSRSRRSDCGSARDHRVLGYSSSGTRTPSSTSSKTRDHQDSSSSNTPGSLRRARSFTSST